MVDWKRYLGERFLNELKKSKADGFYTGDYLTLDPAGYVEVRCMKCDEKIAERKQAVFTPLPNYKQVFKKLNDGTTAGFLFCDECSPSVMRCKREEKERIMAVAQGGWIQEQVNAHRDGPVILATVEKRKDLKIQ